MAQPKIFVRHSHNDDAFTGKLVNDLRQAGANATRLSSYNGGEQCSRSQRMTRSLTK